MTDTTFGSARDAGRTAFRRSEITRRLAAIALIAVGVSACSPRETILPGARLDPRDGLDTELVQRAPEGPRAISLPPQIANSDWTHKAGAPDHAIQHPALATSLRPVWRADIGEGAGRKHRITADPVVAAGRIFTLDSRARVSAVSTSGTPLWSVSLAPPSDRSDDASGGGLAVGGGRVFVTSGFGTLAALDAATGGTLWRQDLDAAATGAPTVVGDTVYAVSRDSRGWAIDAGNGRVRWQVTGLPSPAGVDGGAAPAVTDRLALFPMNSGEVVAASRADGTRLWTAPIVGSRLGQAYGAFDDVTGDPVFADGVIYVGNPTGRMVALDATTGERLWTAREGAMSPPWVAGGSVFIVTDQNELVRLDAQTGERVWGTELPLFTRERPRRRKATFAHYGPILAGGRLIVASDDGLIRSFDPVSGALTGTTPLPGGATSNPIVAGRTLYVVSQDGTLHAFR